MPQDRKPPVRPPPDPDVGKSYNINCRAKSGCPGRSVTLVMRFRLPTGGQSIRYQCEKCKGYFHITF